MFAVLLKVVPDLDQLRFDPERKTVVREGNQLYANPFDQRAVRVALDLRRPGESVAVVSMGPPSAETVLRECLALGVDRAILVTDRALAGSDTLVTSRTLARALRRAEHRVVLTGLWSTDSETGQVPAEVAALLGVPILSGARELRRDPDGPGFEITTDTPEGWARYRANSPFVVTVGEKITKIKRPTPAEVTAVPPRRVERMTAADLGLATETIGLAGSPTVVESIRDVAPSRAPLVLDEGTPAEQAAGALERLRELLSVPIPATPPMPARGGPLADADEVLVLVTGEAGTLREAALPVLSEVRRALAPLWPSAAWIGPAPSAAARQTLGSAGALRLRTVIVAAPVYSDTAALALEAMLDHAPRAAALIVLADAHGRDSAGQVAARRGLGLTGDAVAFERGSDGEIRWQKPSFGGGILAAIRSKTRPSLATVRPGSFEPGVAPDPAVLDPEEVAAVLPSSPVEALGAGREEDDRWGNLDRARTVVAVGMGLGGPEHLDRLRSLLDATGAALAATRRVVDAGWVPRQLQVGLTGRSLAPELAVLLGVSGAVNHLIGWKRARALLAVNVDPKAPVFRGVDVGIVGRWEELLVPLSLGLPSIVGPERWSRR